MRPLDIALASWAIFAIVWIVMSFGRRPAARRENPAARLLHFAYMGAAFLLLFRTGIGSGFLRRRFVPPGSGIEWLGALLAVAGVAFAVWARVYLGTNWSAEVTIRENHELIDTGPYARIRHPIYTGMLLAMLGTAIAVGEVRGLLAVVLATVGFWWKARREERFLEEQFGPRFEEHRRRTGFFLPRWG